MHWDRKRYHMVLSKREGTVPIKSPLCCAAFSHQEGLHSVISSCGDVLLVAKRFWLCSLFCCGLLRDPTELGSGCTEGVGSPYSTCNPSLSLTWLNLDSKALTVETNLASTAIPLLLDSIPFHGLPLTLLKCCFFFLFGKIIFNLDQFTGLT